MFVVNAKSAAIVFAKLFAAVNAEEVVQEALARKAGRVVFIDTPSTEGLAAAVTRLKAEGVAVVLRDHHGCPEPKNDREKQVAAANQALRDLLGDAARISTRDAHPACSGLVEVGEFAAEGTLVVADADADGLTAALKAVGIWYPELDADAAVLDGPAAQRTPDRLSPCAALLTKGFAAVPPFDPKNPGPNQKGMQTLFQRFADAVQGDEAAKAAMAKDAELYEAAVAEAKKLAETAVEVVPGVWLADATALSAKYDVTTFAAAVQSRPGAVVSGVRTRVGPIAAKHGVQISLAVKQERQKEVNLQGLLPAGFESSPDAGIISNTTFLLHVSEAKWQEVVLPALRAKFGD
jgi:hypothetical protein